MVKKSYIVIGVIVSLMVMVGCAKKAVKEEPLVTGKAEEQTRGKPSEEAERAATGEKGLEASLERKKYPGMEGEFLESSLLKNIHFGFDRYDLTPKAKKLMKRVYENPKLLQAITNQPIQPQIVEKEVVQVA